MTTGQINTGARSTPIELKSTAGRVVDPPLTSSSGAKRSTIAAADVALWLGVAALVVPTLGRVARDGWATEQGAHAIIVLATGLWVIWGLRDKARAAVRPASSIALFTALLPCLLLYFAARMTGLIELEGLAVYGASVALIYGFCGTPVLRVLWFPLVYLLFIIPIPQSIIDSLTQPLKIGISNAAVSLLSWLGYSIAQSGVMIYIDQYELLVAAACAGLNSIISLTAIGIFYIYLSHASNPRYTFLLMFAVLPIAILANFVRVLILILLTHYAGEAAAQGFLHSFAGLSMFAIAVVTIFAIDKLATPLRRLLERREVTAA